jgi:sec-independent protein translocase protein TatC
MSRDNRYEAPDPDDMFADSRMSFGDHIEDLRSHLFRAIYGFLIIFVASFFIAKPVLRFIAKPVEDVLAEYYQDLFNDKAREILESTRTSEMLPFRVKVLKEDFGHATEKKREVFEKMLPSIRKGLHQIGLADWTTPQVDNPDLVDLTLYMPNPLEFGLEIEKLRMTLRPPTLSTLSVQEAFVTYIWVAIVTGLVLSSPWVFYQIWAFVAAGLYPHEKRLVHLYLPLSLGLFLAGVFICEFFVIPKAVEALLWFNKLLGMQPDLRLSEWLGFAIFMPLVFGISFQTPLVMLFVERIGLVSVQTFREKRKFAIFFLAVFAAVITPSTDIFSMEMLHIPMCLLYELGILMCAMSPREKLFESESEEPDELIEV